MSGSATGLVVTNLLDFLLMAYRQVGVYGSLALIVIRSNVLILRGVNS